MNDYSKTISHLKKSESLINKKKIKLDNSLKNKISNQKHFFKINTIKKDINNNKGNSLTKKHYQKKISANLSKNINYKKRANSYIDKEKFNTSNNQKINTKKVINNKSYNYGRNKSTIKSNNNDLSNINSKIMKKINENSRNHINFFENYEKNKLRKKLIINNNDNNSINHGNKTYINNNISEINEQRFANSYFNTIFNNNNEKKKNEDNYFSLSQNIGDKKSNILRKINTNLSINNDKFDKYKKNILNEEQEYNRSHSQFYSNKSKNNFYSNYLINNDNSNNNNLKKEKNSYNNEGNINSYNYISKFDNNAQNKTIQNKQPLKINDNNTTINLAGSYNFHQYFNTIINNRNNNNSINADNRSNNKSNFNRNYNRNKTTIDNYNNKIYNNVNYCQTQIVNSLENDNKNNNNLFINDKLIEEVNDLKLELENNLKQNPTNSKSKKYNTLKHSFEKFLKLINEYFYNNDSNFIFIFLQKLLIGFHEVVIAFSSENRKLKELNYKLNEEYEKIDKNLIQCNKIIKEKQNRIEILEKQLYGLINSINITKKLTNDNNSVKIKNDENNLNNSFFNNYFDKNKIKDSNNIKFLDKGKNEQYIKIRKINENNLDDLDALYFFDKIDVKPQRAFSCDKIIPFLPFSKLKK